MPSKPSHILGMNARYFFTKLNSSKSRKFGFSKLKTKILLQENKIATAKLYHVLESMEQLEQLQWETIPTPFVIKPVSGSAGKGILVILEKKENKSIWLTNGKERLNSNDLELHIRNILDGEFSTWGSQFHALIEEMIPPHPKLAKLSYQGTPDVRVIVFNSVPVMAMLRIPTKESNGKANLDKGALGIGVDIATGITTYGIKGKGESITHFPKGKKKINGVSIPFWSETLELAVAAANVAEYQFMGADLFIHETKGPMVVELNGFPGLSIQLANKEGLKKRLERVEGLEVHNAKHGVKIAQALFAEEFADKIKAEEGLKIISIDPQILVYDDHGKSHKTPALVSTSRYRSAISQTLAEKLGLVDLEDLLWRQQEEIEGKVPVIEVKIRLKGKQMKTAMIVSKRLNRSKHDVELGRKDTEGFLIGEKEN
ncbi:MAG: sugar-transfer associated ATP-grasp domain-containing protein [Patescibacteria group bacterium]